MTTKTAEKTKTFSLYVPMDLYLKLKEKIGENIHRNIKEGTDLPTSMNGIVIEAVKKDL